MSEMEEIKERIKESEGKLPKRKIGKRGKIAILGTVIVIVILIGAYLTITLPPLQEKYWKPDREFVMPNVDWNKTNSSYVLGRGLNDIDPLTQVIGNKVSKNKFIISFIISLIRYDAHTDGTGDLWLQPYLYAEKNRSSEYRIKELEFHFSYGNDRNVSYWSIDWCKLKAKNIYLDVTPIKSGPYGPYYTKLDSDWDNQKIVGVNKDAKDIKDCGFSFPMQLSFFDKYPHWTNHTITMSATLYYGHPTLLGWQDVHELRTSVKIYVVPWGE